MILNFFKKNKIDKTKDQSKSKPDPARYEEEKAIAMSDDITGRLHLASASDTHKEILYYMATHDDAPEIRKAVALNPSTPPQASKTLSTDKDIDVRFAIAQRLMELLPTLDEHEHSQLYAFTVQALGDLALDEVLKIRKAMAETLKDIAQTPPKIAGQLARDIEREVSEPILRFCAALSDEDLLDILKSHPASWALQAIASRDDVSEPVSHAVIESDDRKAGMLLIQNQSAQISKDTLSIIIEKSKEFTEWQQPVATRHTLSRDMAKQLSSFVGEALRDFLKKREFFDDETTEDIAQTIERRVEFESKNKKAKDNDKPASERVAEYIKEDKLDDEVLSDAIAMRDYAFIYAALEQLTEIKTAKIKDIFAMHKGKPIVALCWKAGLSMRIALQLQQTMGHVQPKELVYPRNGTDYPISEEDLNWQIDFLDL